MQNIKIEFVDETSFFDGKTVEGDVHEKALQKFQRELLSSTDSDFLQLEVFDGKRMTVSEYIFKRANIFKVSCSQTRVQLPEIDVTTHFNDAVFKIHYLIEGKHMWCDVSLSGKQIMAFKQEILDENKNFIKLADYYIIRRRDLLHLAVNYGRLDHSPAEKGHVGGLV